MNSECITAAAPPSLVCTARPPAGRPQEGKSSSSSAYYFGRYAARCNSSLVVLLISPRLGVFSISRAGRRPTRLTPRQHPADSALRRGGERGNETERTELPPSLRPTKVVTRRWRRRWFNSRNCSPRSHSPARSLANDAVWRIRARPAAFELMLMLLAS